MLTSKDVHVLLAAADTNAGLFVPRAAIATLLRTQGSAFRRAGSRMLIGGNGTVVRGFSGGCPESDLVLRAQRVIDSGQVERAIYDREHGLDLLIELGCEGELEIVLEPLSDRSSLRFLDVITALWKARTAAMMATVFPRDPKSSTAIGRLIWRGDEILLDTLNDQVHVRSIIAAAVDVHASRKAFCVTTIVGGNPADVLYEPILPPIQLVLVGTHAVADAVAHAAVELSWQVVRVDPKAAAPHGFTREYTMGQVGMPTLCDSNTFVICMTYQLERDIDFAVAALATATPYVGILGSHRRAEQMRKRLHERCGSVAPERLFTPAGLSIASEDAEQIAISLIAEIMAVAARKSGLSLSRSSEPIHAHNPADVRAKSWP